MHKTAYLNQPWPGKSDWQLRQHSTLPVDITLAAHSWAGIASWLEHRNRDWNVAGTSLCRNGRRFSCPGSTLCAGSYFGMRSSPVLPQQHVKDPGHSAKCADDRLQLNTHAPYVCGFPCSDMRHGCMVYTEHAETVAVTRGTSHAGAVSTPPRWIFKHALWKASHSCGITCEGRECARERTITLYKSHHQQQQQHANQKVQGKDFRMCLWWSLCTLYSHDSRWELP